MERGATVRASRVTLNVPGAEVPITVGASLVLVYLAVVPVATMLYASLRASFLSNASHWSLANCARTFGDPAFYRLLGNTVLYGGAVAACAVVLGFGLAFLYARTDTPFRALGMATALVPLIVPGILNSVAGLFLASPRIGLLNGGRTAARAFVQRLFVARDDLRSDDARRADRVHHGRRGVHLDGSQARLHHRHTPSAAQYNELERQFRGLLGMPG